MCCTANKIGTKKVLELCDQNGNIDVYKILLKNENRLYSLWHFKEWTPGIHKIFSLRKFLKLSPKTGEIYKGLHVYLDYEDAIKSKQDLNPEYYKNVELIIVKLTANKKNLIGAEYDCFQFTAVFNKLILSQKDYDNALEDTKGAICYQN